MSMVVDELITLLGFKLSPEAVNSVRKYGDYLQKAKKHAEKLYVGLMTAGAAVQAFAMKEMLAGSHLYKFGHLIGQSTESIQKWAFAMEQAGGSSEDMMQDFALLTKAMKPVMPGEYNQALYGLLGFDYTSLKDVDALMKAVNQKFQGMSQIKATNWAQHIGLTPEMAVLMRKPWEEIKGMFSELEAMGGIVSEHDLEKSREFEKQYDKMRTAIKRLSMSVAGELAPAFTSIVLKTQDWLKANQKWLAVKIGDGVKVFNESIARAVEVMDWLKTKVIGILGPWKKYATYVDWMKVAIWSLTGATIAFAVATIAAVGPWILLGLGIAAAGYIIYDAIQYFRGMSSATGSLVDNVSTLAGKFQEHFPGIAGFIKVVAEGFKTIVGLFLELTTQLAVPILKVIGEIIAGIIAGIDKLLQKLGFAGETSQKIVKGMKGIGAQGKEGMSIMKDKVNVAANFYKDKFSSWKAEDAGPGTTSTASATGTSSVIEKADVSFFRNILQSISEGLGSMSENGSFNFLSDGWEGLLSPSVPTNALNNNAVPYAPQGDTTLHQENVFHITSTDPDRVAKKVDQIFREQNKNILSSISPGSFAPVSG